jgi:hypothetical protein
VWSDLRNLIQSGIQHIRNQKVCRRPQNTLDWTHDLDYLRESQIELDSLLFQAQYAPTSSSMHVANSSIQNLPPPPVYHVLTFPTPTGTYPQPPYLLLVFKFLRNLVAAHDKKIQSYLRFQFDNFQNVDLLRESAIFLKMIDDFCNPDTVDIIEAVILLMQDAAIGSKQNQVILQLLFL